MKSIYKSRIDGLALLMLITGFLLGQLIGWYSLILIVPVSMLWYMSHEEVSYEWKEEHYERTEI